MECKACVVPVVLLCDKCEEDGRGSRDEYSVSEWQELN